MQTSLLPFSFLIPLSSPCNCNDLYGDSEINEGERHAIDSSRLIALQTISPTPQFPSPDNGSNSTGDCYTIQTSRRLDEDFFRCIVVALAVRIACADSLVAS